MKSLAPKQKSFSPLAGYKRNSALNSYNPGLVNNNTSSLANMHTSLIQTKLTVNKHGDKYEEEADRVTEEVMRIPDPGKSIQRKSAECEKEDEKKLQRKTLISNITPIIQRQTENGDEEDEELLQLKENTPDVSPRAIPNFQSSLNSVLNPGGRPLSNQDRAFFEPRFGVNLSSVRIHTDVNASESARALNARAYTLGNDIVFGAGEYAPGIVKGDKLLAHELTHVVQQNWKQNPHMIQRQTELVPEPHIQSVSSAVGNFIVSQAENRFSNRFIKRAYSSEIPWFFSPNKELKNWASKSNILEAARRRRRVGSATKSMKRKMYRLMPGLGRQLQNFPAGQGVVWWGKVYTCNVFVFDSLYDAGLKPPLRSNKHYFIPKEIIKRSGGLKDYFSNIDVENIQKGDVFTSYGHTGIITSTLSKKINRRGRQNVIIKSFSTIEAGQNGVGLAKDTNVRPGGRQFRRVGREVLKTRTAIA